MISNSRKLENTLRGLILVLFFGLTSTTQAQFGCVSGDCLNGNGTFRYADNTIYVGNFKDGYANGHGVCVYASGDKYVGNWKNHEFNGEGTYFFADGKISQGQWIDSKLQTEVSATSTSYTPVQEPKIWALVIGISKYDHLRGLKFADDDAYRMYSFLKSTQGGAVPDDQIHLIVDDEATKDNIFYGLNDITTRAGENDVIMLYYSGHGLKDCLVPTDYDGVSNKVMYDDINAMLTSSKAKHKIAMIDACHAGGFESSYTMESTKGIIEYAEDIYQVYSFTQGGTALILSSKAQEASIENDGLRQGVFTYYLIKALKGAANTDNDNIIDVQEAFYYIHESVIEYTNGRQTPTMYGDFDPNTPLSIIQK